MTNPSRLGIGHVRCLEQNTQLSKERGGRSERADSESSHACLWLRNYASSRCQKGSELRVVDHLAEAYDTLY